MRGPVLCLRRSTFATEQSIADLPQPSYPRSAEPFGVTAERLLRALSAKAQSDVSSEDFRRVINTLTRFVSALGLNAVDAEEVANEAIVEAYRRGLEQIDSPGAYLFWTARVRAVDQMRRSQRHARLETPTDNVEDVASPWHYSSEDEAIARIFDREATASLVEHALRAANAADDALVVRVIAAWLELADEAGKPPTSREVAPRAGVSHTSVSQALQRFGDYFPTTGTRSSSG